MKKVSSRTKKGKKNNNKYLLIALLLVLLIGVAYAALSSTLTATVTKVTQPVGSWDVGFVPGTVNGTKGGTSTGDITCGAATVTKDSVSVANTVLTKPDDSCTYALNIKNLGSIDARLATISVTDPSSVSCTGKTTNSPTMTCGNITYKITTDSSGSTLLTNNTTLAKQTGSLNVYLVIKYTGTTVNTSAIEQSNAKFTLVYNQA